VGHGSRDLPAAGLIARIERLSGDMPSFAPQIGRCPVMQLQPSAQELIHEKVTHVPTLLSEISYMSVAQPPWHRSKYDNNNK
jgi:hypothetical protein